MYACTHETGADFSRGCAGRRIGHPLLKTHPHSAIRKWVYASTVSGDSRHSESLYSPLQYLVPGNKGQGEETCPTAPCADIGPYRARLSVPIHHEKNSTICSMSASSRSRKLSMNSSVSGLARLATSRKKGSGSIPARLAPWCRKASETMMSR
jgi:hypothetical protein